MRYPCVFAALGLVLAATPAAAASAGRIVFGPHVFTRSDTAPVVTTKRFQTCELRAKYRLVIENGAPGGSERVTTASVRLNGVEVIKPKELSQKVSRLERAVTVAASNTLEVQLARGPAGQLSARLECVSGCLGIQIEAPAEDADVGRAVALVIGRFASGADEVGVSVNGFPAAVGADRFAAQVPLSAGANRLTAVVTNACGERADASARVYVGVMDQKAQLDPRPAAGVGPMTVTLHAIPMFGGPVAQYEWDLNGDGKIDQSGADLAEISTTYATAGLYLPRVTLIDRDGKRYTEAAPVQVFSEAAVQALLARRWEGLRAALDQQDVDAAAESFAQSTRERYRSNFAVLRDILPLMADDLGTPTFVRFIPSGALYEVRSERDGHAYSFQVEFMVDVDGIWRIHWF